MEWFTELLEFASTTNPDSLVLALIVILVAIIFGLFLFFMWFFRGRESVTVMSQKTNIALSAEMQSLNTKYNEVYRQQVHLEEQNKDLTEKTKDQAAKIGYLEKQRDIDTQAIRQLNQERREAVLDLQQFREEFDERQQRVSDLTDRITELEEQHRRDVQRLDASEHELRQLRADIETLRRERNEAVEERDQMYYALSEARKEIADLESRLGKVEKRDTDNLSDSAI